MSSLRTAALGLLLLAGLAPAPGRAESQSSNSSSNCSNGRCTRVESLVIEDRHGRRGWVRHEAWRERGGRGHGGWGWGGPHPGRAGDWRPRWRGSDDDD